MLYTARRYYANTGTMDRLTARFLTLLPIVAFLSAPALIRSAVADPAYDAAQCFNLLDVQLGDRTFAVEQTVESCSRAIESQAFAGQDLAAILYNRGWALDELGRLPAAIADYSAAINLMPNYPKAFLARGYSYVHLERPTLAIEDYSQAIRLDPGFTPAYFNRSLAYEQLGEYDQAIQDLSRAIQLEPGLVSAYRERANIHRRSGEYDHAIRDYSQAIMLDPSNAGFFIDRGIVYRSKGDYDRAIQDYDHAIRLDSDIAEPFWNRGRALAWLHRLEAAAGDFDRGIALAGPQHRASILNAVCWDLGLMARAALADRYCDLALAADPRAGIRDSKAFVLWQLGDDAGAGEQLRQAHRAAPDAGFQPDRRMAEFPVVLAQGLLNWLGYQVGSEDGIARAVTEVAIRDFQARHGLPQDGRVSDRLLEAMKTTRPN